MKLSLSLRFFLTGILLCAFVSLVHSQEDHTEDSRNIIYVELSGNAGGYYPSELFSLNYERLVFHKTKLSGWIKIGSNIPRWVKGAKSGIYQSHNIPIMMNFMWGKKLAFIIGLGAQIHITNSKYSHPDFAVTSFLGLQFRTSPRNGLLLRAGLTPTIGQEQGEIYFGNYAGASIGTSF